MYKAAANILTYTAEARTDIIKTEQVLEGTEL